MADCELAKQILKATHRQMRRVLPVNSASGLIATPVFHEIKLGTIEHLLDASGLSPDEVVTRLATPTCWDCGGYRASTGSLAVSRARRAIALARSARVAAAEQARADNLPALLGTVKQRAWANQIRAAHAAVSPDSQHLQTKVNASWWIENRRAL